MSTLMTLYLHGALQMVGARDGFVFGGEDPTGGDCSGVVSWALFVARYPMRLTAQAFVDQVFTTPITDIKRIMNPTFPTIIAAVEPWSPDVIQPEGSGHWKITHIAPVLRGGFVVDAYGDKRGIEMITLYEFERRHARYAQAIIVYQTEPTLLEQNTGRGVEYTKWHDPEIGAMRRKIRW